jgi:hypothetical protein
MSYLRKKYQMDTDSDSNEEYESIHEIIQEVVADNKIKKIT